MNTNNIYVLLKELFLILDEGDQQLFATHGLSVTRYYTLHHLYTQSGISLSDLSRLMLCDKSNVTRIVKSLEKDGYVIKKPHETDKRATRLYLTEKGKMKEQEVRTAHQSFNDNRFKQAMSLIDSEMVFSQLTHFKNHLQNQSPTDN